jgi:hypothetical protein
LSLRQETSHIEEYVNHVLDNSLLKQLAALFESGKLMSSGRHKKKRKHPVAQDPTAVSSDILSSGKPLPPGMSASMLSAKVGAPGTAVAVAVASKLAVNDFSSMYDDDIVVSKYVPVGALDEDPSGGASSTSVSTSFVADSGATTVKGLFDKKGLVDTRTATTGTPTQPSSKSNFLGVVVEMSIFVCLLSYKTSSGHFQTL